MTISYKHERGKSLLARLVEMLSFELDIDIASGGSTTWRRQALQKGLEADECYWVQHEAVVRDLDNIDLENDPPPDLAIEVEMSRGTMDRMGIYAAMKVPEVWCWDGQSLIVHVLTARGVYRRNTQSNAFPFLPLDLFAEFLQRTGESETKLVRRFHAWVRKNKRAWLSS